MEIENIIKILSEIAQEVDKENYVNADEDIRAIEITMAILEKKLN